MSLPPAAMSCTIILLTSVLDDVMEVDTLVTFSLRAALLKLAEIKQLIRLHIARTAEPELSI